MDVKGKFHTAWQFTLFRVFFFKSSVASDYNEPSVSVTHVRCRIFYLASLCTAATLARGCWAGCTFVRTASLRVIDMFFLWNSKSFFFACLRSVEQLYLAMMIRIIPRSQERERSKKENSSGSTIRQRALICLTHVNSGGFLLISLLALHQNAKQHIWNHLKVLFYWLLTNVPTNKTQKSISGPWVTLGTLVELPPLPFMVVLQNQLKQDGNNYPRPWHTSSIDSTWKFRDVTSLAWQARGETHTKQEPPHQGKKGTERDRMVPLTHSCIRDGISSWDIKILLLTSVLEVLLLPEWRQLLC